MIEPDGDNWSQPPPGEAPSANLEGSSRVQWIWFETPDSHAEPRISIQAQQIASLPRTVASRVWLRSELSPDGSVRTTAWFRLEEHETAVSVTLPEGAEWISARAGQDPIPEVEKRPETSSYRLRFPSQVPPGSFVLILEYVEPSLDGRRNWSAPDFSTAPWFSNHSGKSA